MPTITVEIPDEIAELYDSTEALRRGVLEDFVRIELQLGKLPLVLSAKVLDLTHEEFCEWLVQNNMPHLKAKASVAEQADELESQLRAKASQYALLQQAGVFADDETLDEMLKQTYAERGRSEVEADE